MISRSRRLLPKYCLLGLASVPFVVGFGCAPGPASKAVVPAPAPTTQEPPAPVDTTFVRSVAAYANRGMVVSAHPLASRVGASVLESGGNAVDAAVAAVAALNVVEPHASGLGGGGFLLYYDSARDSLIVIDYRERAPLRLNLADFFQPTDTLRHAQRIGGTSVCTPGAPAGWQSMHDRFGTRPLSDLFKPAIELADSGYPVSEKQAALITDSYAELQGDSLLSKAFLVEGLPPPAGYILKQPRLGKLLSALSRSRLTDFYYPPVSSNVLSTLAVHGSRIRQDDFMSYRVRERQPLRGMYHGYEIITLPPPSSGGVALLEILKLMEPYDVKQMGILSPDYIHTLALATRQALTDDDHWVSDPDFDYVPIKALLSDEWIDSARTHLVADTVPARMTALDSMLAFKDGNTTHLVVVDSSGDIVTLTQSINYFFGSSVMVPEYGLLLNNHMADFTADSTGAGALAPYHRPRSNMAPTIVRKDGKPVLIIGTPGGARIPATLAQILIDIIDFNLPLNEALNAPRFFPVRQILAIESRIPDSTQVAMRARGWRVEPLGSISTYFGGVQAIQVDSASGSLIGASDPRRDGAPAGY